MPTRLSTIEFISDQLSRLQGVRAQKMFGEYALYYEEKVVALVCDDQLFVKITPAGRALVGSRYQEGIPYPGGKPALLVGADDLEDHELLSQLIERTAQDLPAPGPKNRGKKGTNASLKPRARSKPTTTQKASLKDQSKPSARTRRSSTSTKRAPKPRP